MKTRIVFNRFEDEGRRHGDFIDILLDALVADRSLFGDGNAILNNRFNTGNARR